MHGIWSRTKKSAIVMMTYETDSGDATTSALSLTEEEEGASTLPTDVIQQQKETKDPKNENRSNNDKEQLQTHHQKIDAVTGIASGSSKDKPTMLVSTSASPATTSTTASLKTKNQEGITKSGFPAVRKVPAPGTPLSNLLRFPLRVGITWKKGERLEAMDFSRTWYPSKIVDIDEEEKFVLIHFEGWNSRYDEWVPMASDKLRPQTRHSERKEKNLKKCRNVPQPCSPQEIYRPGDLVLAKWTDCKKYPAKVCRVMPDGAFEVIFYDGVAHIVQPINIQTLPEEMKMSVQAIQFPPSPSRHPGSQAPSKSSFKNIALKLPEGVVKRSKSDAEQTDNADVKKLQPVERKNRHMEKSIKKSLAHISGSFKKSPLKTHRLKALQGSCKVSLNKLSPKSDESLSSSSSSSSSSLSSSSSCTTAEAAGTTAPTNASGKLVMVIKKDQQFSTQEEEALKGSTLPIGARRIKKRAHTDSSLSHKKKRKHKLKEAGLIPKRHVSGGQRAHSLDLASPNASTPSPLIASVPQFFVPSKAFVVEEDHNPYKCPHDACTKEFRKENLLTYHIKYYHTNPDSNPVMASASSSANSTTAAAAITAGPVSPVVAAHVGGGVVVTSPHVPVVSSLSSLTNVNTSGVGTPVMGHRRRRRKTDSFCSTDSDMSVSSKGKSSSKRQRHDSEISVTGSPDLVSRDLWADVKLKAPPDSMMEDYGETEEEDVEPDLVNCICQIRETNGLMIQCDVCMCWQHFTCVDMDGSGRPPANYVCLACERPKGVRGSCKYMYDMGWERRGELPTFPFLPPTLDVVAGRKAGGLKQLANECHSLTSTVLGIKAVLHSMRRQIKISKEEDEPEFQLWQTDWDNWIKPEEDLTLTPPHSIEALPSPAPSTFMFPPAPNSPPAPSMAASSSSISNLPLACSRYDEHHSCVSSENPLVTLVASTSSSSSSSFSETSTTYQDRFKHWLSAKDTTSSLSTAVSYLKPETCTTTSDSSSDTVARQILSSSQRTSSTDSTPQGLLSISDQAGRLSPSGNSQCQSNPLTPPMNSRQPVAPPQTPSSERSNRMISTTDGGKTTAGLSCNLFSPGPGGDASNTIPPTLSCPGGAEKSLFEDNESDHGQNEEKDKQGEHIQKSNNTGLAQADLVVSKAPVTSSTPVMTSPTVDRSSSSVILSSAPPPLSTPSSSLSSSSSSSQYQSLTHSSTTSSSTDTVITTHTSTTTAATSSAGNTLPPASLSHPSQGSVYPPIGVMCNVNSKDTVKMVWKDSVSEANYSSPEIQKSEGKEEDDRRTQSLSKQETELSNQVYSADMQNLHELFVDVGSSDAYNMNADEEDDNDTDTAEESAEPYRDCERNLLIHISRTHSEMENELEELERQIGDLENSDLSDPAIQLSGDNALNDVPALKKSLGKLVRSFGKISVLSLYR